MTPITLTPETSGSIHVDSVDVSKGVYAVPNQKGLDYGFAPCFAQVQEDGTLLFHSAVTKFVAGSYPDLKAALQSGRNHDFYTLSGQRITLEKELTIADLKDSDHVGFVDREGDKGFLVYTSAKFVPVSAKAYLNQKCNSTYGYGGSSLQEAINKVIENEDGAQFAELYLFSTRTGSEDSLFGWLNK